MRRIIASSLTTLLLGGAGTAFANGPSSFPSALPPVSNPGECYAQVKIPAQYSTGAENVLKADGFSDLQVTDAQFQSRQENVMTKEPSVRYVVKQPSYRSVSERILTRPGHDRLSVSPVQFSTVTETLQTSAPHLVWKRGNPGDLQRQGYVIHSTADGRLRSSSGYQGGSYATTQNGGDSCGPTCEIWCLVEEPGTSVTTKRRVMSAPPRVVRTPVAPEYKTLTKRVVSDPGGVQEIPVPAEYTTVIVDDLVRPAEVHEVHVPPVYGDVETKVLVSPERYEWRRVLCQPGTGSIRSSESYGTSDSAYSSSHTTTGTSGYPSSTSYGSGSYSSGGYNSGGTTTYGSSQTGYSYGQSHGSYSGTGSTSHSVETGNGHDAASNLGRVRGARHRRRR